MALSDTPRPREQLSLAEAREQLRDGDIVLGAGKVFMSSVVRRLTGGSYSHCGFIAFWNGEPMVMHADVEGGVQATPLALMLSRYPEGLVWMRLREEARPALDTSVLLREAQAHLGLAYGVEEILHATAHLFLGVPRPRCNENVRPRHCSAFIARCFRIAGVALSSLPDSLVTPHTVSDSPKLEFVARIVIGERVSQNPPASSVRPTEVKPMSEEFFAPILSRLPDNVRAVVQSALDSEALVHEGLASYEDASGPDALAHRRIFLAARDEIGRAREAAVAAARAFLRGDASSADLQANVGTWRDGAADVLWRKVTVTEDDEALSA